MIPVKKSGLGLQKLVMSANEKSRGLQCASMELVRDVMGESDFSTDDHLQVIKEEISEGKIPG